MMTPAQSLATIAALLESAMEESSDNVSVLHSLLIQAHTYAVIQCVSCRRAEARATFAAYPELEHGAMQ